jgi:glycosyltransferase involved in cell wall biosynthesis
MKYSVVIPVYKNEESIPRLIVALTHMSHLLDKDMEVVFVVDGSPDKSFELLQEAISSFDFPAQLLAHSRNFGSFAAIRSGLIAARGEYFGVMAADLQEPPELVVNFFNSLSANECDVVVGTRLTRGDPWPARQASGIFWGVYRRLVVPDMPQGGVDVFGCNLQFREQLVQLEESRSSLIALIFWLGFRRKIVGYERQWRQDGKSAWTFAKKLDYMFDSIYSFTDLPIRLMVNIGALGLVVALVLSATIMAAKLMGLIAVPGYAATMLVVLVFGALNLLGLGLIGTYAWRAFENTKRRPLAVVARRCQNERL